MAVEASNSELVNVVALLGAGVIAVPIFKRAGLGSILGYLAAGLAIGPFGLGIFSDPAAILHVAELGVVMFLFIIGLEMQPSRLWGLRRDIFGLGALQVGLCALLLTACGLAGGFPVAQAFVAGAGFVLTSTAIVMQLLEEQGEIATPKGQRMVSILLLEDLAIVPLLALVAFLAPGGADTTLQQRFTEIGIGIAAIVGLVVAGRYLLNPLFRVLADARAREVMTAAALLVVLGSALAMQMSGFPWRWAPSSPACFCQSQPSATSSRPISNRFAASCSACSFSPSACRSTSPSWPRTGSWSRSTLLPTW